MWDYNYNDELYHFGVKGMKWGVRRKRPKTTHHEDYTNAHSRKSVKSMSDKELRSRINRLNMEREYSEAKRKANKGQRAVQSYIKTAGTIAAFAGATATYKKYGKKYGDKIVDAIGDYVFSELKKGFQY